MIGMNLASFITLLVISAIWSAIFQAAGYRVLRGIEGYFSKVVVGWIGAWIGSPVLGYWGGHIVGTSVFVVPAILGSLSTIFVAVAALHALMFMLQNSLSKPSMVSPEERRAA